LHATKVESPKKLCQISVPAIFMMSSNKIILKEWVQEVHAIDNVQFQDIHFDLLNGYIHGEKVGIELLQYSIHLLKEARIICENTTNRQQFKPMIYLPLGYVDNCKQWDNNEWQNIGKDRRPPELLLFKVGTPVYKNYFEEYRCPIDLPVILGDPIVALYRCSRDDISRKNGWEFYAGVDIYYQDDF